MADNGAGMKKGKFPWKRLLIMATVTIMLALVLEWIQLATMPQEYNYEPSESGPVIREDDEHLAPFRHYVWEDELLIMTGEDPQMYINTGELGTIYGVTLLFGQTAEKDIPVQLYYIQGEEDYSEAYTVKASWHTGEQETFLLIPAGEYSQIRIDFECYENIPLTGIRLIDEEPTRIQIPPYFRIKRVALVAALLFAAWLWMRWVHAWDRMKKTTAGAARGIREEGKKAWVRLGIFLLITGGTVLLYWLYFCIMAGKAMTVPRLVFAIVTGLFIACLLTFRKTLKTQPEYLFLVLVLCAGFLLCYFVPHTGLNSWDEDVHYEETLKMSYVAEGRYTPQDYQTIARVLVDPSWDWSGGGVEALHTKMDAAYAGDAHVAGGALTITTLPEVFNAIGLFAGRALGLRYYMIHFLGRFFGLVTYAILGFFAIRKLKSGKMIAAVSLLIPTGIFLASSYNYDCYLTGFTALGLCYYIRQWQERDKKLSLQDAVIMIASFAVGCLTKPVYLPLMWILILLPRSKFSTNKAHTAFVGSMAAASFLLILSYVLPIMINTGEVLPTDWRAGDEVGASGQLAYILEHPIESFSVLLRYMTDTYFDLGRVGEVLTNYAYHGIARYQYLYLMLLVAAAFTDKNEYDRELVHHPWAHIWPIIVSLGTTLLVITSMYMAFTPIGADRVDGAQFRYMIPMVLPVLMHIGSGKVENRMNRGWYNGLILAVAAFVIFADVHDMFIIRYI